MVSLVSFCILLACCYGTFGDVTTATSTTNGGPKLLHIISSTERSISTSYTKHTVTSTPNYSSTDGTVTSDSKHGQTDNHPSTSVPTNHETSTSSDHTYHVVHQTSESLETADVKSENNISQNATLKEDKTLDSGKNDSALETAIGYSTTSEDTTKTSTDTEVMSSVETSSTPGDTGDVKTTSRTGAHQPESSSAVTTPSTPSEHTSPTAAKMTTRATTTQHSVVSQTIVSNKTPTTSKPGTSKFEESVKREEDDLINSNHLYILGICIGLAVAMFLIIIVVCSHRALKNSWKKKICLNGDAKRTDWSKVRRFTINDVKASLGGIPANGDIWMEMNKDSSCVL